jgi:hypothetical protein
MRIRCNRPALTWAQRASDEMTKRVYPPGKGRLKGKWRRRRWKRFACLVRYFGSKKLTKGRMRRIRKRIRRILQVIDREGITFLRVPNRSGGCSGSCGGSSPAEAYTHSYGRNRIYLCPGFFVSPFGVPLSTANQAKTILHEVAHEIGLTRHKRLDGEKADTDEEVQALARSKPWRAGMNPDSFAWFFFAVGQRSKC